VIPVRLTRTVQKFAGALRNSNHLIEPRAPSCVHPERNLPNEYLYHYYNPTRRARSTPGALTRGETC